MPTSPAATELSIDDARQLITSAILPIEDTARVSLFEALGRICGRDIVSPIDVPAQDNSAMDGYAFCARDLAAAGSSRLRLLGVALAGLPFAGPVQTGCCVRIMTGAVMPEGTDTVIPQERVAIEGDWIQLEPGQIRGRHRRLRGEDIARGQIALNAGARIRAAELGVLASLGLAHVDVVRRLRVAIFSTGDELRLPGETLAPGTIYDSNRFTLYAMLSSLGVEIIDLGVVRDDRGALEAVLRGACLHADVILSSGGVSMGEADHMRAVLLHMGDIAFWNIAMKPGRAVSFGWIAEGQKRALLFGLPGNPVAVMVTFYALVRGALQRLAGEDPRPMTLLTARTATDLAKQAGRTEYQRGIAYRTPAGWQVRATGAQGSGILSSMTEANCLIVLPEALGNVPAGAWVEAMPFDGLL